MLIFSKFPLQFDFTIFMQSDHCTHQSYKSVLMKTVVFTFLFAYILTGITTSAQSRHPLIRPKINTIVHKLKQDGYVHFGYSVGFAAKRETGNKYYKRYKRLSIKATNEELVELT